MKYLIFALCLMTLIGCKKHPRIQPLKIELSDTKAMSMPPHQPYVIDVSQAKDITTSDLCTKMSKISYIQLDSKELIGELSKMIVTDDKIYIMDSFVAQQVFVFDKKGKLLFCIDQKGHGPGDFISIWDIQVDTLKNEILVNDALGLAHIYYSTTDGSFIRKERAIQNCYVAKMNNYYFNVLSFGQDFNGNEPDNWQLLVSDKDSVIYKGVKLKPIQKNNYITNSMVFDSQKQLFFTPVYSDTIYQINSESSICPKYVIKQEKSIWEKCDNQMEDSEICRLIKEENYTRFTGYFVPSDNYAFFSIYVKYQSFIRAEPYIWDKTTGNIYRWDVLTKSENLYNYVTFPEAVNNNCFYGVFNAKNSDEFKNVSPELSRLLKSYSEDSNPIVVSYELGSLD